MRKKLEKEEEEEEGRITRKDSANLCCGYRLADCPIVQVRLQKKYVSILPRVVVQLLSSDLS